MPKTAWPGKVSRNELEAEWHRQQLERRAESDSTRAKIRHRLELLDTEIWAEQLLRWRESRAALERLGLDANRLPKPIKVHPSEYTRTQRTPRTHTTTAASSAGRKVLYRPVGEILEVR